MSDLVKVRLTSARLIDGDHYPSGALVDVRGVLARDLVNAQNAILVDVGAVETAVSPHPPQTAVSPVQKRKRRKAS